jgi:hypothetical protein
MALALVCALAACGNDRDARPRSIAVATYRGVASGAPSRPADVAGTLLVVWTGNRLHLTLWGSGSCPAVPVALRAVGGDTVEITVSHDYGKGVCTTDMSPTTSVLELPAALIAASPGPATLTVRVGGRGGEPSQVRVSRTG